MSINPPKFKPTNIQWKALHLFTSSVLHTMLYGGSRSGKTFILLLSTIYRAMKAPGSRHLVLRRHFNACKRSIVFDTLPKVMALCQPNMAYKINRSDWFMVLPNGSEIWFGGLDDQERADKILGMEFATIYFNESSEFSYESIETAHSRLAQQCPEIKNRFYYDCNPPSKRHWTYMVFIEGIHPNTRKPLKDGLYCQMRLNPGDNIENLPQGYIDDILANMSRKKRLRFLAGEFSDDAEGALWKRAWIDDFRVKPDDPAKPEEKRQFVRVVVAVDPAISATENSDTTGIVVCAKGIDKHYYTLEDRTGIYTPAEWGAEVNAVYKKWSCDSVVAEVNQGGDMVESNIHNINPNIRVIKVHATRGKAVRAEPITGLSERGLIHHVGEFPMLEDHMCGWNPITEPGLSPGELDAMVWGMTELSGGEEPDSDVNPLAGIGHFG